MTENSNDNTIVRAAIHPGIGIARVGNSENEYYFAPEVTDPPAQKPGFYRDSTGALKREAARFRIYGYNATGEVVRELTTENAEITWSAHLVNQKAAWYEFQLALDIPEAIKALPSKRRNAEVKGPARQLLVIDPGSISISGANTQGCNYFFDKGKFFNKQVYLGELRTDECGRLVVLGGRGKSESKDGTPATTYANNEGWYDDTSDGPITATVTIDGQSIPVDPAWVVVAPPNYGPMQKSVRTMYDLMTDVYIQAGRMPLPETISFTQDILPIFLRMSNLEWVNKGFAAQFGWESPYYFQDSKWIETLASTSDLQKELRQQLANMFREYHRDGKAPQPWPWLYGDAMNVPPANTPRQNAKLTDTQLNMLQCWADGNFINDYNPTATPPAFIQEVPLNEQPAMLDRAALDFCLADAFHPGCEMTWPMRHATMYMSPYRIRHRPESEKPIDYGSQLTPVVCLSEVGPLYAQSPGDITRWMAVPWQTDTASCKFAYYAGYGKKYDPYLPTFWPARVPNQVLSRPDYDIVMDQSRSLEVRRQAFYKRSNWFRTLGNGNNESKLNNMIAYFDRMGIVEVFDGPTDVSDFPAKIQVEVRDLDAPEADETIDLAGADPLATVNEFDEYIEKINRFPQGL
ncbi:LodA/GoxA family CTQ-dependent oxidase [Okeania sp. KiyG1]|uniref:LodA/GoxA family CTQ-dependent oxidase n=1 Tax=Okeania sp. KiyG1 TaxID=2720165 RepID=UPI001920BD98|nr:LodA/GoxA family CTQ-dependent oxidase [Okeania sp. KiyG1]GGA38448.1 3-isopropylmalate dehydrogenase [Okeania sp. KiyG1]